MDDIKHEEMLVWSPGIPAAMLSTERRLIQKRLRRYLIENRDVDQLIQYRIAASHHDAPARPTQVSNLHPSHEDQGHPQGISFGQHARREAQAALPVMPASKHQPVGDKTEAVGAE